MTPGLSFARACFNLPSPSLERRSEPPSLARLWLVGWFSLSLFRSPNSVAKDSIPLSPLTPLSYPLLVDLLSLLSLRLSHSSPRLRPGASVCDVGEFGRDLERLGEFWRSVCVGGRGKEGGVG